ncbi:MAG: hypothetical protein GF353_19320 [Candidatus Lokiarchaeota archaeon]|nr:hypothetical protein [Candidatus Lokiarchaeota archaeon]
MSNPDKILGKIEKIGKNQVILKLHDLYSVADTVKTRLRILEILNQLRDDNHFEEIENYFISDKDSQVRMEAAKLLAFNYNKKKAIKPLLWVLDHEEKNEVKLTALRLLIALGSRVEFREIVIEYLKKAVREGDEQIKSEATEAIGFLRENSAEKDLIEMLESSNNGLKLQAIRTLGVLKNKKAVPKIMQNLKLNNLLLWEISFRALKKILTNKQLNELSMNYLTQLEKERDSLQIAYLKCGLIKVIGELRLSDSAPFLLNFLKDYYQIVREETINSLNKIVDGWRDKYKTVIRRKGIKV